MFEIAFFLFLVSIRKFVCNEKKRCDLVVFCLLKWFLRECRGFFIVLSFGGEGGFLVVFFLF